MTKKDLSKLTMADMKRRRAEAMPKVRALRERNRKRAMTEEGQAEIRKLLKAFGIDVEGPSSPTGDGTKTHTEPMTDQEIWDTTPDK